MTDQIHAIGHSPNDRTAGNARHLIQADRGYVNDRAVRFPHSTTGDGEAGYSKRRAATELACSDLRQLVGVDDHPGADGLVGRLVDQDEAAGAAVVACRGRTPAARSCAGARGRCRSARSSAAARRCARACRRRRGRVAASMIAVAVRVVCLSSVAGRRGAAARRSSSRRRPRARARRSAPRRGGRSVSPRETSSSSSRRSVSDSGAIASSSSPSKVSIAAIRVRCAAGQHDDLVAGAQRAAGELAGVAAVARRRRRRCGSPTARGSARARRRGGRRRPRPPRGGRAASGPSYQGICSERSTTLSPRSARDRDVGDVARRRQPLRERRELRDDLVEALLRVVDEVHLVDGDDEVGDAEQRADERVARDCSSTPLRASSRITARSAVEAPVTMLRVYCWWPGQSAMMKRRCGVAK